MESKEKNKRTTYKRINSEIRMALIERVINKKQNIKDVVNNMGVNISTAKAILKVYQEEGRVGKKKKRDKVINVIQTYSFYAFDGDNVEKLADTVIEEEKKSIQTSDSRDIERDLKEKSKERAEQLIKETIEKYISANETAELQRNMSELTAMQGQFLMQYCNQTGYQFGGMGFPFK